jgi:hypothetical protein
MSTCVIDCALQYMNAGQDSVAGIATRYVLDSPGIETLWE